MLFFAYLDEDLSLEMQLGKGKSGMSSFFVSSVCLSVWVSPKLLCASVTIMVLVQWGKEVVAQGLLGTLMLYLDFLPSTQPRQASRSFFSGSPLGTIGARDPS